MLSKKKVHEALKTVMDPELHMSIVDMGLIYKINVESNKVTIDMTLTSIGCPLFSVMEKQAKDAIAQLGIEYKDITINLVFEPPWSMDKMTKKARLALGFD